MAVSADRLARRIARVRAPGHGCPAPIHRALAARIRRVRARGPPCFGAVRRASPAETIPASTAPTRLNGDVERRSTAVFAAQDGVVQLGWILMQPFAGRPRAERYRGAGWRIRLDRRRSARKTRFHDPKNSERAKRAREKRPTHGKAPEHGCSKWTEIHLESGASVIRSYRRAVEGRVRNSRRRRAIVTTGPVAAPCVAAPTPPLPGSLAPRKPV